MRKTEKKYWKNGHQKRGGFFHTINISIGNIGLMFSCGIGKKAHAFRPQLKIFKLI